MKSRCPLCGKKVSSRHECCPCCGTRLKDAPKVTLEAKREDRKKEAKREEKRIALEEPIVHIATLQEGQETPLKKSAPTLGRRDTVLLVLCYLFSVGFPILGMVFAGIGLEQNRNSKKRGLQFAYGFGFALSLLCFVLWIFAYYR